MPNEQRFAGDGFTGIATAALTSYQYCLLQLVSGTNMGVTIATGVTEIPGGVLQNAPASGGAADVKTYGIMRVKLGGTVTVGAKLTATTGGAAVAASPAQGVNNAIWGFALEAGDSGDIITMLGNPFIMQGA